MGDIPAEPSEIFKLSPEEFDALLEAFERPARPMPRLTRSMRQSSPWEATDMQ